jgi:hypothetical protein
MRKEEVVAYFNGLRKTTQNLTQDSRSPGRDLNLGPPKYEALVLTTRLRHSLVVFLLNGKCAVQEAFL